VILTLQALIFINDADQEAEDSVKIQNNDEKNKDHYDDDNNNVNEDIKNQNEF